MEQFTGINMTTKTHEDMTAAELRVALGVPQGTEQETLTLDELMSLVETCASKHVSGFVRHTLLPKLVRMRDYQRVIELEQAEEPAVESAALPVTVPDWHGVVPGTLVRSSSSFLKENPNSGDKIGIVVGRRSYADDLSGSIVWPTIHWQSEPNGLPCHPMNARLFDGNALPGIIMNANQK